MDYTREHERLQQTGQWRSLQPTLAGTDGYLVRNGQRLLNVASNDYLALRQPWDGSWLEQITHALEATEACPMTGAGASRLVVGHDPFLAQFEERFARFKGKEAVIAMPSGYAANVGLIQAFIGRDDEVFADRYIHASLYDGIHLSRARLSRYGHLRLDELEGLLAKSVLANRASGRRWIVTDAVFSMDGTVAPLPELVELAERYHACLIVDEAHAGGLFGERGQGLVHALGLQDRVAVIMGTFSKAYGAYGGYVAADRVLIDQMVQAARSLIYSTALPNVMWASVQLQWERVQVERWRVNQVLQVAAAFANAAKENGLSLGLWGNNARVAVTPITPVIIGGNDQTIRLAEQLQREGIAAIAIRPPTVPDGQARIRFSWTAAHTEQQAREVAERTAYLLGEQNHE